MKPPHLAIVTRYVQSFITREVNVKAIYLLLYSITHRTLSFSAIDIFFQVFIFSSFHFFLVFSVFESVTFCNICV